MCQTKKQYAQAHSTCSIFGDTQTNISFLGMTEMIKAAATTQIAIIRMKKILTKRTMLVSKYAKQQKIVQTRAY
jgi:hypothetical protein